MLGRRDPMRQSRLLRGERMRVRRITHFSLNRMIPNILTLLALCAGMTAIRFAINGKFEAAVIAIIVAAVFDGLDGRVARLLKASSSFGAQLDSLSDFISFGVAPAVILYLWTMSALGSVGWVLVLFFAVCCGLRLARFNTQLDVELPAYAYNFFTGVPAPAGAGLVLVPMFAAFEWGPAVFRAPWLNAVVIACVAALMVSRLPTFSSKKIRVQHDMVIPTLIGIGVLAAFLTTAPWPVLTAIGVLYLGSIPFTIVAFLRQKRAWEERVGPAAAQMPPSEEAHATPLASPPAGPPVETRH